MTSKYTTNFNQSITTHFNNIYYYFLSLWDRLDLEVKRDQRKYKTFQILDQVVEDSEAFWIVTLLPVQSICDNLMVQK